VNSTNATPVITPSAEYNATCQIQCRRNAWIANPPSQPTISGIFLVSSPLRMVPAVTMTIGIITRKYVFAISVNSYGGAMLAQVLKHSRTAVMPRLDGFM
jgi:hypothetical protein